MNDYWPGPREVTTEQKVKLASSIMELLIDRQQKHTDLSVGIYGPKGTNTDRIGQVRAFIITERFPKRTLAKRIAKHFNVTLERLLAPKGPYIDPYESGMFRKRSGGSKARDLMKAIAKGGAPSPSLAVATPKKRKLKARGNGQDEPIDHRWVLPQGVMPPKVKLETSEEHPELVHFALMAEIPPDVAMALFSMVNNRRSG